MNPDEMDDYLEKIRNSTKEPKNEIKRIMKEFNDLKKASGACPNAECKRNLTKSRGEFKEGKDTFEYSLDEIEGVHAHNHEMMLMSADEGSDQE